MNFHNSQELRSSEFLRALNNVKKSGVKAMFMPVSLLFSIIVISLICKFEKKYQ